jgi:hypothetical protein
VTDADRCGTAYRSCVIVVPALSVAEHPAPMTRNGTVANDRGRRGPQKEVMFE